jgi:hypothetical protein
LEYSCSFVALSFLTFTVTANFNSLSYSKCLHYQSYNF